MTLVNVASKVRDLSVDSTDELVDPPHSVFVSFCLFRFRFDLVFWHAGQSSENAYRKPGMTVAFPTRHLFEFSQRR